MHIFSLKIKMWLLKALNVTNEEKDWYTTLNILYNQI